MVDAERLHAVAVGIPTSIGWGSEFSRHQVSTYGANGTAYLISMLPVIIFMITMQRWFVRAG
jgi:ABC-type glycerol-3-phosphate transport system permease component